MLTVQDFLNFRWTRSQVVLLVVQMNVTLLSEAALSAVEWMESNATANISEKLNSLILLYIKQTEWVSEEVSMSA